MMLRHDLRTDAQRCDTFASQASLFVKKKRVKYCMSNNQTIYDFRGACAVKGNGAVAGHVKRVDHDDVFDALLFREETFTRHYFILKLDFSWGIMTNMGKTEGMFLYLQCNCHIVGSIIIKLTNHRTIAVHGCQI